MQSERSKVVTSESRKDFQEKRANLRERLRGVNQSSRDAIRNTFLSMEAGELNIAKLAKENNALVVHAIPLDGWSMKNTSMNNQEVNTETMSAKEKLDMLSSKKPDVSASILSVDSAIPGQEMFYPFGFILDGKMVAAYEGDEGTYTEGDVRRRKETYSGTLQKSVTESFQTVANSPAEYNQGGQYNEAIVHQPSIRAILIDENQLSSRPEKGDIIKQYFSPEEESEALAKYGDSIISTAKGVPTSGPYSGKEIFRIERKRSATEKALEYSKENHPDLPIYLRRSNGIYTPDGKKVTAEEIYS